LQEETYFEKLIDKADKNLEKGVEKIKGVSKKYFGK
jgi:hypothetical protein